ncbi:hypothetical protein LVT17_01465, partial [Klebsiella pneumoniae]|nr:hypothetical protein [Klebsiella pneumoniae]
LAHPVTHSGFRLQHDDLTSRTYSHLPYQYGYIGYNATVMNTVLVLLVVLVYLIQFSGDRIVRAVTHK